MSKFTVFAVIDSAGNHLGTVSARNLKDAQAIARNIYVGGRVGA